MAEEINLAQNFPYLLATGVIFGIGIGAAVTATIMHSLKPRDDRDLRRNSDEADKIRATNEVKLKEMEYAEREAKHKRDLALSAKQQEYRLSLAKQLVELNPLFEQYLNDVRAQQKEDPQYVEAREEYRKELVDEFKESMTDAGLWNNDVSTCPDDDAVVSLETLVKTKFPSQLREVPLPAPIQKVIALIDAELGIEPEEE